MNASYGSDVTMMYCKLLLLFYFVDDTHLQTAYFFKAQSCY
jgi:hypothetical protein